MRELVWFFACAALVRSQVEPDPLLVRWNDDVLVNYSNDHRQLIYHDEIVRRDGSGNAANDGPGILICRVSIPDTSASWRKPDDTDVPTQDNNSDFTQFRSVYSSLTRVQLARARDPLQDGDSNNGLWTCHGGGNTPHYVPLYNRGSGTIVIDSVSLGASPSFSSSSPRFTLIADTSGGPPTTFSWRNNAGTISNGGSNSISLEVNPNNDTTGRMNCHYRSTLEVTAVAPGNYTYVADNRDTSGDARMSFVVEGGDPSNLQVVQTGMNMVVLTWDPPPGPPSGEYRIIDSGNNIDMTTASTSLTISSLSLGGYNFLISSPSQHFPGGMVGPEAITVRDVFTPVITLSELTATSVRVSWSSPPMFSFTVIRYEVALRRVTDCNSIVGIRGFRHQNANDTTELFEEIGEHITYRAEVRVIFQSPSSSLTVPPVSAEMEFTTVAISPSEVPSNVVPITTSRTISVSWNAIDCSNENGPNLHYNVDFQRRDGTAAPVGTVNNVMFTVEGLQPFTIYTFRVRGVNDAGNGDYTDLILIQTDQDIPGVVADLDTQLRTFTSVLITWSPPQAPNGIIIMHELTYLLNETISMSENITNRFYTIESVVNTRIEVRVRAYTIAGPGPFATASITLSPSIVMTVQVESLTATSVIVSWDRITDIPGITEYIVYYAPISPNQKRPGNELRVTVPSTENSVVISGLESAVEYQYQVTVVVMFNGRRLEGERSLVTDNTRLKIMETRECDMTVAVSVSVVVTFLLTIILNNALLLVVYYTACHARHSKHSKSLPADISDLAMKENAAYGPVTSSQQPHEDIYTQPNVATESEYDVVK